MEQPEKVKSFQGGIGLAVAVLLAAGLEDGLGYTPDPVTVSAMAYVLGYVAKGLGLKVED